MRKFFSLFAAVLFAGSMMAETYTKTAFADLQSGDAVIITMAKDANVYAASNDKGTSAAPVATAVTVANDAITTDATDIIWTVVKDGSNISFQTGDNFLYCTNSNNGVRVGTNDNKVFSIDATSGYLYNNATSRYIGVYNSADFRCYTSVNSNISGQTLAFYAKSAGPAPVTPKYYVAGSMNGWKANEAYKLTANPSAGDYRGEFNFKANDELKVIGVTPDTTIWYPAGTNNNYVVTDSADYDVIFYPEGNELLDNKFFTLVKKEPVVILPQNCAEIYAKAKGDQAALKDVIVTYVSGKNVWVRDAEPDKGSLLLFLSANATWNVGDTLSNVAGEVDIYQNIVYELKPTAEQVAAVTAKAGAALEPEALDALTTGDVNKYVALKGAAVVGEFTTASATNLNMVLGEDTIVLRNNFKLAYTFAEGKLYDVVGVVSAYKGAIQVYFISATETVGPKPEPEDGVIYNWAKDAADQVGTTILGGEKVTVDKVKIHENTDDIDGIKFASSYVYADGKWIAIKPAEGAFKAGDTLKVCVVYNNTDATKYCMVDLRAADGDTRIWMSDSLSTLNGRNAGDPVVQNYVLAADADSLFLGRYGNTGMFIPFLQVVRPAAPVVKPVYTVVGSSAPLFGKTWDPTYEANNMEPITGSEYLYAWKKEGVALTAGKIEYKVCQDHGWATAWPAQGNYDFTIDEAGLYDVTIFFNPDLETPTQVIAEFKGSVVVLPNIILHGNFTGSWADTEAFIPASDSVTASLTLALAEGKYEFGFKFDGTWKANGANLTREANTTNLAEGSGNMFVTADVPGNYIFTYTYATQDVVVTYPEPIIVPDTVVVDAVTYGEVYTEDFEQYGAVDVVLTTQQIVEQRIEGDGFLFVFDIYPEDANNITGNYYVDSLTFDPDYSGIMEIAGADTINYEIVDGAVSFILGQYDIDQKMAQLATIAALEAEDGTVFIISAAAVVYYDFIIPQGVEDVTAEPKKVIKKIEMGNVVIEKNGVRYNINGQMIR